MGCDIHIVVEVRQISGYNRKDSVIRDLQRNPEAKSQLEEHCVREGPWQAAACKLYDPNDLPAGWFITTWDSDWNPDYKRHLQSIYRDPPMPFWDDRDYEAFARLAGVRNYQEVDPISPPRGTPVDYAGLDDEEGWLGDHSYSWLLAQEILEFKGWGSSLQREGLVDAPVYRAWKDSGADNPSSWCRDAFGGDIQIVEEDQIPSDLDWKNSSIRIRCRWETQRTFGVVEMAKAWADRFGADAVRFTFGFDS